MAKLIQLCCTFSLTIVGKGVGGHHSSMVFIIDLGEMFNPFDGKFPALASNSIVFSICPSNKAICLLFNASSKANIDYRIMLILLHLL